MTIRQELIGQIMKLVILGEPFKLKFNKWLTTKSTNQLWDIFLEQNAMNKYYTRGKK